MYTGRSRLTPGTCSLKTSRESITEFQIKTVYFQGLGDSQPYPV